ncbi:helix-turn-helix domain-containing protein [Massilia sp. erpn]|uniref:helix-turn-helix domain-containing protein n=1 Tax=Massilia sp. erpn TaxID=2738142 RepID=UPI0021057D20|nr:XRE family transcriptional regulator [Massilia sp. erpn]UTY60949.1 helix-turn-helix transcriptional regulator [Massilia sp. erpn]
MAIRLKILRKQYGWSLERLAEQTGLTKSYLSKVERGLSTPSIAVALKLSQALQVEVEQLFAEQHNCGLICVTRADARLPLGAAGEKTYESMAAQMGAKRMMPFMVYPPRDFTASAFKEHAGEEFLFVHQGDVEVEFPTETVRLAPGDSLYFNSLIPHRTRSVGEVQAQLLVLVSNMAAVPE